MKTSQIISLLLLLGGTNIFGMIAPKKLYVKNNIGMNRNLLVTWKKKNIEIPIKKPISNDKTSEIVFDKIEDASVITFGPEGDLLQYTAGSVTVKKDDILAEFQKLNLAANDSLEVTVSQGWLSPNVSLTYGLYAPPPVEELQKKENLLLEFSKLAGYPRILAKLDEKKIMQLGAWDTDFIPGYYGGWGQTTAEDIYRYILDLSKNPTKEQVEEAYRSLSLKWHPDKFAEENKEYAERVFKIIGKAHDELMKKFD